MILSFIKWNLVLSCLDPVEEICGTDIYWISFYFLYGFTAFDKMMKYIYCAYLIVCFIINYDFYHQVDC